MSSFLLADVEREHKHGETQAGGDHFQQARDVTLSTSILAR